MPHMRDILSRFRPAGSPGAGRAAVPADRRSERESELGQVLILLDGPNAECAAMIAAAQREAEEIVSSARNEADAIIAAARRQAASDTDQTVLAARAAARVAATAIETAGAAEASAIGARARARLPALADQAVARLRELDGLQRPPGRPGLPS